MLNYDEIEAVKAKKLCYRCVGEAFLSGEIRSKGRKLKCSYCGRTAKCFLMSELSERVDLAFEQHYERTGDQPEYWEYPVGWYRNGEPVVGAIMNAAEIPEGAAIDIQQILEEKYYDYESAKMGDETEFADDSHYTSVRL